jgi:hypothetical protein
MKTLNLSGLGLVLLTTLIFSCQKTAPVSDRKPPVVNAGPAQSIILPLDSVLLSGRATDSSSTISAYLWSEVSGPNVPVIENEGSSSTIVTGLIKGTYVFQLMAIDSFGLTGVDTMSVVVSSSVKNNEPVTLSPIDNPNEYQWIGNSTADYSGHALPEELGAEDWTVNGVEVAVRAGFRFDLSNLSNTQIASAKLTLYSNPTPFTANLSTPNYGTSNQFYIQRINSSWNSTSNWTWATQPTADSTAEVLIPQTNLSSLDLPNIDVTQLVKNMIAEGNYGFMIRLQNEVTYNSRIFCSSSYPDSTKRPLLIINY